MASSSNASLPAAAQVWIDQLGLKPHPEGGYYREVARGNWVTATEKGDHRFAYTTIYFLLTEHSPSHLHRIQADEVWLHHAGDPIDVHVILEHPQDEKLCEAEATPVDPSTLALHAAYIPPALETNSSEAVYEVYRCVTVGSRTEPIQLQYTVPRRAIFGSTLSKQERKAGYTLVSCVVAPGFNFKDFEVFTQNDLMAICPQHEKIIRELAYETLPA